jgi:hypothetical protein
MHLQYMWTLRYTFVIILFGPNLRGLCEMFVNISKLCHISFGNLRGLRSSEWCECGVWNNHTWYSFDYSRWWCLYSLSWTCLLLCGALHFVQKKPLVVDYVFANISISTSFRSSFGSTLVNFARIWQQCWRHLTQSVGERHVKHSLLPVCSEFRFHMIDYFVLTNFEYK